MLLFQNVTSSFVVYKDFKVKRHPAVILPVVFMDVKRRNH